MWKTLPSVCDISWNLKIFPEKKNIHPLGIVVFWVHVLSLIQTLCELQNHFSFVLIQNICQVGYQYHMHVHQYTYHTELWYRIFITQMCWGSHHFIIIYQSYWVLFGYFFHYLLGLRFFFVHICVNGTLLCIMRYANTIQNIRHSVRISNPPFW